MTDQSVPVHDPDVVKPTTLFLWWLGRACSSPAGVSLSLRNLSHRARCGTDERGRGTLPVVFIKGEGGGGVRWGGLLLHLLPNMEQSPHTCHPGPWGPHLPCTDKLKALQQRNTPHPPLSPPTLLRLSFFYSYQHQLTTEKQTRVYTHRPGQTFDTAVKHRYEGNFCRSYLWKFRFCSCTFYL